MRSIPKRFFKHPRIRALITFLVVLFGAVILNRMLSPSASELVTTTSEVSVEYCSEGESTSSCDPAANVFSEETVSNTVSLALTLQTVSDRTLCLEAEGEVPLLHQLEGPLTIKQGNTTLVNKSTLTTDANGKASFELRSNDMWTEPAQITFKPKGYFARTLTLPAFDPSVCVAYTGESRFIRGDFNDDGTLNFDDVALLIKAYRGTHLGSTSYVFGDTKPEFGDVLDLIKKYRQRENYHDA